MTSDRIAGIAATTVGVSAKSNWIFVELELASGAVGLGEATLHGYETLVAAWLNGAREKLVGKSLDEMAALLPRGRRTRAGLVAHAGISALEQARADLQARALGVPVASALGVAGPVSVPLYANLNRGLTDRHPDSFAARAARAVAAGYRQIKIAPFDGVSPDSGDAAETERLLQAGLDRVGAVRDRIGRDSGLFVDCHWRLNFETALRLVDELARLGVSWLECPLAERPASFDAIARLRSRANAADMLLAGAELEIGEAGFLPYLGLYDVVMPDIKYCGGPAELLRIAEAAQRAGCRVAPHNPSGPVAHAHSVHCAAHPALFLLEAQFDESPLFGQVVAGRGPRFRDGAAHTGDAPGIGLALESRTCRENRRRPLFSFE